MLQKLREKIGYELKARLSPSFVSISRRCKIAPSVSFKRHHGRIEIGEGTQILRGSELLAPVKIGRDCWINRNAYIRADTTIGDRVNIGPFVNFVTDHHEISNKGRRAGDVSFKPIVVEDGAWIGIGVTILGGVTIGRGAIVMAGSMVTANVSPDSLVGGYPARAVRGLEPLQD